MKRVALLALALALLLAGPATAAKKEAIGLDDVIKALEVPFKAATLKNRPEAAIHDVQADFFQESTLASLDRVQRGRGRVAIKFAPSQEGNRVPRVQFRWEYEQPTTQEIVSDGRTLWVYLPENRQVIQSDIELASRNRPGDPVTFLTGLGNLSRDFYITWASPNQDVAGNFVLELRPIRVSAMIQRLLVVVDRDAIRPGARGDVFPILSTTVFDPSGNSTLIEFSDARVNRGLPDSQFRFILPAGVEVVRPTGQEMGF